MKYFFVLLLSLPAARETDFSSASFRVRDPVILTATSTQMSSANFRLYGSVGQIAIGTSSATTLRHPADSFTILLRVPRLFRQPQGTAKSLFHGVLHKDFSAGQCRDIMSASQRLPEHSRSRARHRWEEC